MTSTSQAICLTQQHTKVPGEDDRHTESTRKAVTESLQRADRCLCASAEAKQYPQLSKPAGSRNAVHPRRQHQGFSEHHEHGPQKCSTLCNVSPRVYTSSSCDVVQLNTRKSRRPQHECLPATPGHRIQCHASDRLVDGCQGTVAFIQQ